MRRAIHKHRATGAPLLLSLRQRILWLQRHHSQPHYKEAMSWRQQQTWKDQSKKKPPMGKRQKDTEREGQGHRELHDRLRWKKGTRTGGTCLYFLFIVFYIGLLGGRAQGHDSTNGARNSSHSRPAWFFRGGSKSHVGQTTEAAQHAEENHEQGAWLGDEVEGQRGQICQLGHGTEGPVEIRERPLRVRAAENGEGTANAPPSRGRAGGRDVGDGRAPCQEPGPCDRSSPPASREDGLGCPASLFVHPVTDAGDIGTNEPTDGRPTELWAATPAKPASCSSDASSYYAGDVTRRRHGPFPQDGGSPQLPRATRVPPLPGTTNDLATEIVEDQATEVVDLAGDDEPSLL